MTDAGRGQSARGEFVSRLAGAISTVATPHPLRVAIDGAPASGKTTLADELAVVLRARGRDVIRCYFDAHDRGADTADVERSWRERYIPAQQLYFTIARPTEHADIIVHNERIHRPAWEVRPRSAVPGGL